MSYRVLISCIIGTALEWYDFVIYGYFAVVFGTLFFSEADPVTQILASWAIFWSGFLARPIGSLVFGHIGDKISRKYALIFSLLLMAVPTTAIGLLPTYTQVGILAPILLIILRTLQGFALGGEFTGAIVFLVEHAPLHRRGFWGSWAMFSAVVGVILGSCIVVGLNAIFSTEQMHLWGWRIPFLISILGSFVGIYIRMHLSDPALYLDVKARESQEKFTLKELFLHHKSNLMRIFFLDFLTAVGFFIIAVFFATYLRTYLKYSESVALSIHTINMFVLAISTVVGGSVSDHRGRKPILFFSCIGFILFSYPAFKLCQSEHTVFVLLAQAGLAYMLGIFLGAIPATIAEILPTNVRFSGVSFAHNVCMAVIGGGTPFVATHLIYRLNDLNVPAYLIIFASIVSLCTLYFIQERYNHSLNSIC